MNDEKENRIELFIKDKVYTYIKDKFGYNFNGFIITNSNEKIIFKDDDIGNIPIHKNDIHTMTYSNKLKKEGDNT